MNSRKAFMIVGIIAFFVFGSSLLTVLLTPDNMWWTPYSMRLSLDDTSDRFEIFVGDQGLYDRILSEDIYLKEGDQMRAITKNDFSFRVNNWHKVRASKIGWVAVNSALTFGGLLLLIYGLIPFLTKKRMIKE